MAAYGGMYMQSAAGARRPPLQRRTASQCQRSRALPCQPDPAKTLEDVMNDQTLPEVRSAVAEGART